MNKDMEVETILQFQKQYQTENNRQIEKEIRKKGIHSACLNSNLNEKYSYQFNLEIPEVKIYNQHKSYQCNIYAFFRVAKSIM